jgi:hypothetical protein
LNDSRGCLGWPPITGNEVLITMMLNVEALVGLPTNSVSKMAGLMAPQFS